MDAALALQYVAVGLAVAASALYVVRSRFPNLWRRAVGHVALRMIDSGSPRLVRIGRRIAPAPRAQDACGACNGCEPKN